jgi:uncharacterized protein
MSDTSEEILDRRDFMIASIVTVGASAALAVNAGAANAQDTTAQSARRASQGTVYTGDVVQGKKVVSALNIDDLESGAKHLLYFQGAEMPTGQHWNVSVIVVKGVRPGKRITLVSGVHGDEMSSVHTVQTVMSRLNAAEMSGAVMAVLDVARPALESMQRRWPNSGRGIDLIDMNREWPGNENGISATSRQAGLLFNRLLKPNSDLAIDFHTGATGFKVAAFNIGDRALPDVKTMMDLYPIGQIVDVGIPCFTPEVGAARVLDPDIIALFVEGTMNVLKNYGIIAGPIGRTAADANVFVGNSAFPIIATQGGFVEHLVKMDEEVKAGQKVAIQRDTFGEVVAEYTSGVDGKVTGLRSDVTCEPGNPLGFILFNSAKSQGAETYPE